LVEGYSEAHVRSRVEYVRALMGRPKVGAGAKAAIKNPAGLLARAIEQSYVVPEVAAPARPVVAGAAAVPLGVASADGGDAVGARKPVPGMGDASPLRTDPSTAPAVEPPDREEIDHPVWAKLAGALRERVSGATYAAWIAPARPLSIEDETPADEGALTLVLPTAFALDRWWREPIAAALREASAAVGVRVTLEAAQTA